LKKSHEKLMTQRKMEKIRLMRRNTISLLTLKEKIPFFKKIHFTLNSHKNGLPSSQINPVILKNYFDYAIKNEKDNIKIGKNKDKPEKMKKNDTKDPGVKERTLNPRKTKSEKSSPENKPTTQNIINIYNYNITNINLQINHPNQKNSTSPTKEILSLNKSLEVDDMKFNSNVKFPFNKGRNSVFQKHIIQEKEEEDDELGDKSYSKSINNSHLEKESLNELNELQNIYFCDCPKNIKIQNPNIHQFGQKRFSLISNQILNKINENTNNEGSSGTKSPIMKRNSSILKNFRKYSTMRSGIQSAQGNLLQFCHICGGVELGINPALEESITTYIEKGCSEKNSRRSSEVEDHDFYRRESILPIFIKSPNQKHIEMPILLNSNVQIINNIDINKKNISISNSSNMSESQNESYQQVATKEFIRDDEISPRLSERIETDTRLLTTQRSEHSSQQESQSSENEDDSRISKTSKTSTSNKFIFRLPFFDPIEEMKREVDKKSKNRSLAEKLSKLTTVRLVFLVLIIFFVTPYLDIEIFQVQTSVFDYQLQVFEYYLNLGRVDTLAKHIDLIVLNETKRMQDLISFGFIEEKVMCQYPLLCERFSNSTIFFNSTYFNKTRSDDKIYTNSTSMYFIYSVKNQNKLEEIFQILRLVFVAILLWIGAFLFLKDANSNVVIPLENTYNKIKNYKLDGENFYCDMDEIIPNINKRKNISRNENNEIISIENFFFHSSKTIVRNLGLFTYNHFKNKILNNRDHELESPFISYCGYVTIIELTNYNYMIQLFKEDITIIISRILEIIDYTSFEYFGEFLKFENGKFYLMWKINSYFEDDGNDEINSRMEESLGSESYNINDSYNSDDKNIKRKMSTGSGIIKSYSIVKGKSPKKKVKEGELKQSLILPELYNTSSLDQYKPTFSLLTTAKITGRILNDSFILDKWKERTYQAFTSPMKRNSMEDKKKFQEFFTTRSIISFGKVHHFITSSQYKIDSVFTSFTFSNLFEQRVFFHKYNIKILICEKVHKEIDPELKRFCRDLNVNDIIGFKLNTSVYSFDLDNIKNINNNPHIFRNQDPISLKTHAISVRKELIEAINSNSLILSHYIKADMEIRFLRVRDLSFVKFYNKGIKNYNKGKIKKSISYLKNCLVYEKDEFTQFLIKKLEIIYNLGKRF
jgi:hypothetical protein